MVDQLDDMPAELGLDRGRDFILLQRLHDIGKGLDHLLGLEPAQIALVRPRTRIRRLLGGNGAEIAALFQLLFDRLGFFLGFHKDMGCIVFDLGLGLAAEDLVISGFQFSFGRLGGGDLFQCRSSQIGAALDLEADRIALAQILRGDLCHGGLADHLVKHQIPQGRIGQTLGLLGIQSLPHGDQLTQRDRLAIDSRDHRIRILRERGQRAKRDSGEGSSGKKRFQHRFPFPGLVHFGHVHAGVNRRER